MGKLVMGYWDCPFCGTQGNRGDVVNCPACGRARGEVTFYMKDHIEGQTREQNETGDIEYVDEEKAKTMSRNPDWYCSFCNSLNSDNAAFCSNCGATRESSESNYFQMQQKKQERERQEAAAQSQPKAAAQPRSKRPLFLFIAVVLIIVGIFVFMNGNKTSGDLSVASVAWERTIQIEENIKYSESDWVLPQGAEQTGQRRELHHYETVLDHYESRQVQRSRQVIDHYETYYTYNDLGNGMYEQVEHERPVYDTEYYYETVQEPVYRQEPRYQTKYYYDIWRWTPTRTEKASGTDHSPAWPAFTLGENEREGEHKEKYSFTVTDKDQKQSSYSLPESNWMNLNPGDSVHITAKRSGADPFLSDAKGNKIVDLTPVR